MENIKEEFEKRNNTRDWFVEGGRVDHDTPEKYVYDDFTTDMCWTCFFDAYNTQRLRADTAEARVKTAEHDLEFFKSGKNEQFDRAEAAEQRISALVKALKDTREALGREYWDQYAGLDETRDILDAALNPNLEAESHE